MPQGNYKRAVFATAAGRDVFTRYAEAAGYTVWWHVGRNGAYGAHWAA